MLPKSHLHECTFATATQETHTHIKGNHGRIPTRVWQTDQNHGRWTIPYIFNRQRPTILCQHTPSSPLRISGQTQGRVGVASEPRPTEWCAPNVVTPKKNTDSIRMCIDLSRLNRYVRRERYQSQTPAQAVTDIAAENAKIFTKLDATKGYHQCPLDEESQLLTTFITPFGRFKYLRAPYGISSIAEHYNRRMDEAFAGLTGFRRIVDDVVIFNNNIKQHADHVRQFLWRCKEKHITLNIKKWQYAQTEVDLAVFIISD